MKTNDYIKEEVSSGDMAMAPQQRANIKSFKQFLKKQNKHYYDMIEDEEKKDEETDSD